MSEPIKFGEEKASTGIEAFTHWDEDADDQVWNFYAGKAYPILLQQDLERSTQPDNPTLSTPTDVAELAGLYADAMLTEERKRRP